MSHSLNAILESFRDSARTEREKGTYFERLCVAYYDYVVNGKSAIEWVMERQGVSVDRYNPKTKKGSDIENDSNRYAIETMGDPRYPYDLLRRVITVSLETVKIVKSLPKLDI